ncbi:MAG TPA: hypothetical protein VE130_13420 [Nitrososphaeraceae archaeon]|nr:hypothetical protein [Nitrososphaeraceae archaeon]
MIEVETIAVFTTEAGKTGHMSVLGKNGQTTDYNLIRYCPFCAKEIKIIELIRKRNKILFSVLIK